jgi:hypothetical protein
MNTRDREPEASGPLKYAPKWARMAEPAHAGDRPASAPRPANAHPPERKPAPQRKRAPEPKPALERRPALEHSPPEPKPAPPPREPSSPPREPVPPWKPAKQPGTFEGDVAIKELRERLALAPDQAPEPPMRDNGGAVFGMVGRLAGLVALAAITAYGFVWFSAPRIIQPDDRGFALAADQNGPLGRRLAAPAVSRASLSPASLNSGSFKPAVLQPPAVPAKADPQQSPEEAPPVDRPQLLAPVPWPVPDTDRDLASRPRETLTTGAAALAAVPAPAPHATPALRPTPVEAEIAPPPAAAPRIANEDLATFLARGRTSLANGDVAAARLAFRRAAEGGDAQAALALGGSFDPLVLRSLGAVGVAADPDQARNWYQKAAELGSRDAPQRLNQLAQSTR